jgi:DNA-binding MarR family transcriptional regulator
MANVKPGPDEIANLLHSASIKLLRRLRSSDVDAGLTSGQASVLSVLVYAGDKTISELAMIEQVRLPTMSRLIRDMEKSRLIERLADETDGRISRIRPTQKARTLLEKARLLRLGRLQKALAARPQVERDMLHRAAESMLDIAGKLDG